MGDGLAHWESIDEGWRRLMDERLVQIGAGLAGDGDDPDTAVHEARKGFKRLRALLRLARPALGERLFARHNLAFRDAARRLAGARDSAVMIETLDNLAAADGVSPPPAALRRLLVDRYEAARRELLSQQDVLPAVQATLVAARHWVAQPCLPGATFDTLAAGIQRVYAAGRRQMARAVKTGGDADLHEWRKQVKYLWYQLEAVQAIWPPLLLPLIEQLHLLSDDLGNHHDLAELGRAAATLPGAAPPKSAPGDPGPRHVDGESILGLLRRRQESLAAQAWPLGRRLYAERPATLAHRLTAYWDAWQLEADRPGA